jgi:hypothetical protein
MPLIGKIIYHVKQEEARGLLGHGEVTAAEHREYCFCEG